MLILAFFQFSITSCISFTATVNDFLNLNVQQTFKHQQKGYKKFTKQEIKYAFEIIRIELDKMFKDYFLNARKMVKLILFQNQIAAECENFSNLKLIKALVMNNYKKEIKNIEDENIRKEIKIAFDIYFKGEHFKQQIKEYGNMKKHASKCKNDLCPIRKVLFTVVIHNFEKNDKEKFDKIFLESEIYDLAYDYFFKQNFTCEFTKNNGKSEIKLSFDDSNKFANELRDIIKDYLIKKYGN